MHQTIEIAQQQTIELARQIIAYLVSENIKGEPFAHLPEIKR